MTVSKIRKRPGSHNTNRINRNALPLPIRLNQTRNISAERAQKILSDNGINIEKDDAGKILELMHQLAKLIVNQNFKK